MKKNNYCENTLYKRAIEGLSVIKDDQTYDELCRKLKEISWRGEPCEYQWNYLRIRYNTRDKHSSGFRLYFEVVNAISGLKKVFFQKDYVDSKGGIRWRRLASAVRRA